MIDRTPQGVYPPTEAMLAEPVPQDVRDAQEDRLRRVWKTKTGIRYLMTVNNSEVGKWYSLTCFAFMLSAFAASPSGMSGAPTSMRPS